MDIKENKPGGQQQQEEVQTIKRLRHHWYIGGYCIIAVACIVLYFLTRWHLLHVSASYKNFLSKLFIAGFFSCIVLIIARIVERIISTRVHSRSAAYNVVRAIRLLAFLIIILVVISFLNANWYAAAASLGLISLILGFALQTPISSLIGWIYIVTRNPFKVGDRIQIGSFTGDVVEINYLDTTLWEFAGNYMTNDLPSGRLIRFPNSMIFESEVYNYSWHKFPYIWNEIPFHVAYESDLGYVSETMRRIAIDELGAQTQEDVEKLRELISHTAVDELEIKEYPFVHFRTNANTWIEVLLIYLVEPKRAGTMRSRLIRRILTELLHEPDRVMFPKSNAR